jgi:hypothetical protein
MGKAHDLQEAKAELAEVKTWTRLSCDTMVENENAECRACAQYRCDVESGIFDDEEDFCDHEGYEVDILTGRAQCTRCPHHWYQTAEQIKADEAREREYAEFMSDLELADDSATQQDGER